LNIKLPEIMTKRIVTHVNICPYGYAGYIIPGKRIAADEGNAMGDGYTGYMGPMIKLKRIITNGSNRFTPNSIGNNEVWRSGISS
jgi:hypothetical protein